MLAARNGRSTEAEIRAILASVVKPDTRLRIGDALAALGREIGLTEEDLTVMDEARDKTPAAPMTFG